MSWGRARGWIRSGKIQVDGETWTEAQAQVDAGAELRLVMNAPRPRAELLEDERVVFLDAHVVVVDKPPGISTVPYDDEEVDTLEARVRHWLARRSRHGGRRPALGVVHRIDKETSGLVVFTRTWAAKEALARQFRAHAVVRRYAAIAHGKVATRTLRSHLLADRGDGLRGSVEAQEGRRGRRPPGAGQLAVTHVEPIEALLGATLVLCRLETGRTHQIRVQLSEAGHPLVGERVYIRGFESLIPAPRLMLHAAELGFEHPVTGQPMKWKSEMPRDMAGVLGRLRART